MDFEWEMIGPGGILTFLGTETYPIYVCAGLGYWSQKKIVEFHDKGKSFNGYEILK